jgi:hypothetical protein
MHDPGLMAIERQIDEAAGRLWGIHNAELDSIQNALTLITPVKPKLLPIRDMAPSLQASLAI